MEEVTVAPVVESIVSQEIDAANAAAVIPESNDTAEAKDVVQEEGQETAEKVEKPKEEPIPKGVQKRIDRAVRQKYEAEARANELARRLEMLEQAKPAPQSVTHSADEPRIEQFESIEDYVSAKAAYVADQRIQHTLTTRERAEAEAKAAVSQQKANEMWAKRVALATAEMPDYEDVVSTSDLTFADPNGLAIIKESDIGPKIAYYLARNEDEADEIAQLTGHAFSRAIGRLEAKLMSSKTTTTKAPPPIEPAGTKAKGTKSPDQMNDSEFADWRKRHIAAR